MPEYAEASAQDITGEMVEAASRINKLLSETEMILDLFETRLSYFLKPSHPIPADEATRIKAVENMSPLKDELHVIARRVERLNWKLTDLKDRVDA